MTTFKTIYFVQWREWGAPNQRKCFKKYDEAKKYFYSIVSNSDKFNVGLFQYNYDKKGHLIFQIIGTKKNEKTNIYEIIYLRG